MIGIMGQEYYFIFKALTCMHFYLTELRTVNEENNPGAVMEIVESGMELEK